mgnify:CR=1 FL=1
MIRKKIFVILFSVVSLSMIFASVHTSKNLESNEAELVSQDADHSICESDDAHIHLVASGGNKTCSKCKGSGKCPSCNGSGRCHYCDGKGHRGSGTSKVSCSWCNHGKCNSCSPRGSGKCSMCSGDGLVY